MTTTNNGSGRNTGSQVSGGTPGGTALRGVLVVESNPDRQWKIARMLTVRGHRVVGTSSSDGALALVKQWPVDVILVDSELPGMSGGALCQRLREEHPDTPVVLMGESEDLDGAQPEIPLSGYLRKPFSLEALMAIVERLGRMRSVSTTAAATDAPTSDFRSPPSVSVEP